MSARPLAPGPELAHRCAACGAPAGEPCRDLPEHLPLNGKSHQGRTWQLQNWQRSRAAALPIRETCPVCGRELHWIYTGHPPDREFGERKRCAPQMQVAVRPVPRRLAPIVVQGDLFAGVAS